uniref:Toxin 31 isoform c n=1 Tax=Cupiennius salei TaxID=6928 RepID=A0A4Y5UGL2_CUPSA|nr:toxin 31 isoform c precursor [Cupiennius salei]
MLLKVLVLLFLVGFNMLLGVHAETDSSEITEEARGCVQAGKPCTWGKTKCCGGIICKCNYSKTKCHCKPPSLDFGLG